MIDADDGAALALERQPQLPVAVAARTDRDDERGEPAQGELGISLRVRAVGQPPEADEGAAHAAARVTVEDGDNHAVALHDRPVVNRLHDARRRRRSVLAAAARDERRGHAQREGTPPHPLHQARPLGRKI